MSFTPKYEFWNKIHNITINKKINGGIYLYPEQIKRIDILLNELHKSHETVNVCESGFGSGHFSSLILSYNFTNLTSFDLFEKAYHKKIIKMIETDYGADRFKYIRGNTKITIPNSIFPRCNMVHVSVPHNEYYDILNFRNKSEKFTILTATSLNRNFKLYKTYFPLFEQKKIIDKFLCENVSSVSSKLNLYMSVWERSNQIHCWSRYL